MVKTKIQKLKEKKDSLRTFKEGTSFGKLQDRITELEDRILILEDAK